MEGITQAITPRHFVIVTFGSTSSEAATDALADVPDVVVVGADRFSGEEAPRDTIIMLACPDEPCAASKSVAQSALASGQLVIAIVLDNGSAVGENSAAARALRPHSDILVSTSDPDFILAMVGALRPAG